MGIDINNNKNVVCFSECAKCVESKGTLTCCGKGGSWKGKCGPVGNPDFKHTWDEGVKACETTAAPDPTMTKPTAPAGCLYRYYCTHTFVNGTTYCDDKDCPITHF